ncbi:MAG: DUF6776 family protein [Pseudomonadota bacterium]
MRPHQSLQHRLVAIVIACIALLLLSWSMYEAGSRSANGQNDIVQEELSHLYDPGTCRQTKRQKLCSQIGDLMQQLQISTTANKNLAKQVEFFTNENNHLKEKLVFFQHLMPGTTKNGISIYHFSLRETQTPGKYRYMLILAQGGERSDDFKGKLKFQVTLQQNDQHKTIPLTSKNSTQDFPVDFKFLHRLEESFKVPPDTIVKSMQVQLYENNGNKVILTQSVQPAL